MNADDSDGRIRGSERIFIEPRCPFKYTLRRVGICLPSDPQSNLIKHIPCSEKEWIELQPPPAHVVHKNSYLSVSHFTPCCCSWLLQCNNNTHAHLYHFFLYLSVNAWNEPKERARERQAQLINRREGAHQCGAVMMMKVVMSGMDVITYLRRLSRVSLSLSLSRIEHANEWTSLLLLLLFIMYVNNKVNKSIIRKTSYILCYVRVVLL